MGAAENSLDSSPKKRQGRGFRADDWRGLIPGLLLLSGLALLDGLIGTSVVIIGAYGTASFLPALQGARHATVLISILSLALAVTSAEWNMNFGSADYFVTLGLSGGLAAFGCYAAWVIAQNRRSARNLEILNQVAAAADGSSPLSSTLERITDINVPELADMCMIDVISTDRIERVAVRAAEPRRRELEPKIAAREPSIPEHIVEGEAEVLEPLFMERVRDQDLRAMARSEEDLQLLRSVGVRSYITAALISRGRRIGAMTLVQAWSGRRHSREDVRFARVLADRVALALENAGLFSDLESVERRMDTVMAVLDEAVVINDGSGRLVFANRAAVELGGFASLEEMTEVAQTGETRNHIYDEHGEPLDRGDMAPEQVLRGESPPPQMIRMVRADSGEEKWLRVRSRAVPGPDGAPIYAVSVFEDVTEMKRSEFASSVLAQTGELLATSTDYQRMLQKLVGLLIPQLADCCTVHLPADDGTLPMIAVAHRDPQRAEQLQGLMSEYPLRLEEEGHLQGVLRDGEPIISADLEAVIAAGARDDRQSRMLRDLGLGSVMVLPLTAGPTVIGTLNFANHADRRSFDDFDRRIGERIAERVAVALDNARIATERSEIAETLQRGLQPPPIPRIPGWSVAALYRPAGAENMVGGDFYDLFRVENGWMLVIGDVTGHGARAASVTALARYTLRTAGALTGNPLDSFSELNRALLDQHGGALCSAAAIKLDHSSEGRVEIAVAGHPPPLLVSAGKVTEMTSSGPVLGAFEEGEWPLETAKLHPGEQLIVYTDGVTEARGSSGRFGEARLRQRLEDVANPSQAVQRIDGDLLEFCKGDLDDDAAFLAVMRVETVAPERLRGERATMPSRT